MFNISSMKVLLNDSSSKQREKQEENKMLRQAS